MTSVAELARRRPARADARKNYDRLIAAARETFAEVGAAAPLEEIARRADVGIATLYRNFPTREILVESVYLEEVEAVCVAADEASGEPWQALVGWLERFVAYVGTNRALLEGLNRQSMSFQMCRDVLWGAGRPLLERAQAAGVVRPDVGIDDVLRLVGGVAGVGYLSDDQRGKVLSIALDGLRSSVPR